MTKLFKKLNKVLPVVLVLLCVFGSFSVAAEEGLQTPAYTNYYYEQRGESKSLIADRPVYINKTIITGNSVGISNFYGIEDIYYAADGLIYILDSGNGRVVVLNDDYSLNRIVDKFTYKGEVQELTEPQGVYVTVKGDIYIADTENQRVLICDKNGVVKDIMQKPESDLIPDDFNFYPISIQIDKSGYLYVLTRGSYYGALMYDEKFEFVGFFGANSVSVSLLEGVSAFINGLFETSAKLANSVRKLPYQFYDFDVDKDGFIYTVSPTEAGQIKKLNLKGNNTMRYKSGIGVSSAENFNFGDSSYYTDNTGHKYDLTFSSIAIDENGYIFALDSAYGKIFVYDSKCNNIAVLGGGVGTGRQFGTFVDARAIETVNRDVLISDYERGSITVMSCTEYGELIMEANNLTNIGEFDEAEPLWEQVLTYNSNRQLAYRGLALVALNRKDYDSALEYSRLGLDQESYSTAYGQLVSRFLNKHLWWMMIVIVAAVIGVVVYSFKHKRDENKKHRFPQLYNCLSMSVHPIEVAQDIRAGKVGSVALATVMLLIFYVSMIGKSLWSGFMYTIPKRNFNLFFALLGSLGVVLLWVLCHWGASAIFTGKAKLKDIYITTCYCLMPLIVANFLFIILSYAVVPTSASFVTVLQIISYIYFGALMVFSFINIQEYSLGKLVGVTIVSAAGMLAVAFLVFMLFMLGQNFISFVVNIASEAIYR